MDLEERNQNPTRTVQVALVLGVAIVGARIFLWPTLSRFLPGSAELLWTAQPGSGLFTADRIAAAPTGAVFVSCRADPHVYVLDPSGNISAHWLATPDGKPTGWPAGPEAIAAGRSGNVRMLLDVPTGPPSSGKDHRAAPPGRGALLTGVKELDALLRQHDLALPPGTHTVPTTMYIAAFTPQGKVLSLVPWTFQPRSLGIGPQGHTYLFGWSPLLIEQIDTGGKLVRTLGPRGAQPGTTRPLLGGIAGVGAQGDVYLAEKGEIRQVRSDGSLGWKIERARCAATSPGGTLYVIPEGSGPRGRVQVARYDPTGRRQRRWRCPDRGLPQCLAADGKGSVYTLFFPGKVARYRLPGDLPDSPAPAPETPAAKQAGPVPASPEAIRNGRAILERALRKLHAARSLRAGITTTRMNWNLQKPFTRVGTVMALKPNLLRVELRARAHPVWTGAPPGSTPRTPPKNDLQLYVSDGEAYSSYASDSRRCVESQAAAHPRDFPGEWGFEVDGFFGGERLLDGVSVTWAGSEKVAGALCDLVQVREHLSPVTSVYAVGRGDLLIRRLASETLGPEGGAPATLTCVLSDIRLNLPVRRSVFRFTPPSDAQVVPRTVPQ